MCGIQWKKIILILGLSASIFMNAGAVTSPDPYANETKEERDARMGWWRDARFGLFIHWGVYAVPAGTYKGEQIDGIGEWIMLRGKIPVADYKAFANEFNPVKYDPQAWAKLAHEAGMRYIVITSKHHDGFALFPSAVSDWDVADATPYGKDLIGPLAAAARAEGLKFGLYYSQAQDWTNPGGAKSRYEEPEGWDPAQLGSFDTYLKEIAAPQVGEILARYQPDILWWDTPRWMNNDRAETLLPLLRIKPGIIHNNRLGGDYKGDTETPEQHIPATGFGDRDWEVCMTMNHTWGYKSYDHDWKSAEDIIQKLCDIVSKGGNFLLNVGPTAEGEIPQASIDRLKEVGKWMDVNSESIYGTTASPFHRLVWGRATKKIRENGATLYLQIFDWPENGKLIVPGLKNLPASIMLLGSGETLSARSEDGSLVITLPANAPDPYASVLKLEIDGDLNVDAVMPGQGDDGSAELTPSFADVHNRGYGEKIKLEKKDGKSIIKNWVEDRAWLSWTFKVDRPGLFKVCAEVAAGADANLTFGLRDGDKTACTAKATGGEFELQELGEISLDAPGVYHLELRPVRDQWTPVALGSVILKPAGR
jgi:alpha-L-fucosidase